MFQAAAQAECQSLGASVHLPSVHNTGEWTTLLLHRWIEEKYGEIANPTGETWWLGLKDSTTEMKWVWQDDSNYDWNYWAQVNTQEARDEHENHPR